MHLDLLTLVAMGSFVAACAGAALLIAWSQNRTTPALALWGLADIVDAAGIAALMLSSGLKQHVWALFGAILLALVPGIMWKAARTFESKPAPLALVLLGTAVVALAAGMPGTRNIAGPLSLAFSAIYYSIVAMTVWQGRKERLTARWPIVIIMAVHAGVMFIGIASTLDGSLGAGEIPAVFSLFGFIHFENIAFTLGTAVFVLALAKERNEAASDRSARVDALTGIANRAAFTESAERAVEQCGRQNVPVSVIMCDLDRFKAINDTHGHAIGDAVIQKFCEIAADSLWPNDVLGRIGGEEFAIVLPRASIEAACIRAERIRTLFAESCRSIDGHQVDATVSCGVSASADADHTLSELLRHSDLALYGAKAEGRNRVKRADQPKSGVAEPIVIRVA